MVWVATAIIGGAIVGTIGTAIASGNASGAAVDAAKIQSDASLTAAGIQKDTYNQTRNDLLPFQNAGRGAISYANSLVPGGLSTANPALPGGSASPGQVSTPAAPSTGSPISFTQNPDGSFSVGGQAPTAPTTPAPNYFNAQTGGLQTNPSTAGAPGAPAITPPPTGPADTPSRAISPIEGGTTPAPAGQSPFLTTVENNLPNYGTAAQNSLTNFIPGSGNSPLQSGLYSFVNGASDKPNPLLAAANNSVIGGSATPNAALGNLESFIPGSSNTSSSLTAVNNLLGLGSQDPAARQAALAATPGYQFTLDQGLKATQNGYAAQGLGSSGAAMKGAAQFATGLADSTYQSQLNNYLTNYNNQFQNAYNLYNTTSTNGLNAFGQQSNLAYNSYGQGANVAQNATNSAANTAGNAYTAQTGNAYNLLALGSNAGSQTGTIGAQTSQNAGQYLTGGAAAAAGGVVGSANALNAGITGVANTASNAAINAALFRTPTPVTNAGAVSNADQGGGAGTFY